MNSHNQNLLTQDTAKLITSSETLQLDIQRLATNLDVKLVALEAAVQRQNRPDGLTSVNHLKATITSASTVMSSKATVMSLPRDDVSDMPEYMSDFGDWFRSESSVTTLQWIYSDVRDQPLFDYGADAAFSPTTPTSPKLVADVNSRKLTPSAKSPPRKHNQTGSRDLLPETNGIFLCPATARSQSANDISPGSLISST